MSRELLDIQTISPNELQWLTSETYCNSCNKPDLGIVNPTLYNEDGEKFIEGNCSVCGTLCKSKISDEAICQS